MDQCGGTKSLGPDGFNFNFVKKNWKILGADFIRAIFSFYNLGFIPRCCNASFISLVPKKDNSSSWNDFRPISLVGCIYKVISKMLANVNECPTKCN